MSEVQALLLLLHDAFGSLTFLRDIAIGRIVTCQLLPPDDKFAHYITRQTFSAPLAAICFPCSTVFDQGEAGSLT